MFVQHWFLSPAWSLSRLYDQEGMVTVLGVADQTHFANVPL